jgi:mono/diheme cytochrome c family protein
MRPRPRLAVLAAAVLVPASVSAAPPAAFDTTVKPVLTRTCYSCHNEYVKNADLNLQAHATEAAVVANPATWEKVVQKMSTRVMPPPGSPAVTEAERKAVVDWIESTLARADELAPPNPGRVTARRLNRAEYDNSVRDLLGVDLRLAQDFPQDDTGYGFDNNGDVLSLSPALMEKYLLAAEKIASMALFGPEPPKPGLVRLTPARAKIENGVQPLLEYDTTGLSLPQSLHAAYRFPVDAEYVLRVVLGGERPAGSEPIEVGLFLDDREVGVQSLDPEGLGSFTVDRQDYTGKTREFRVRVAAGEHRLAATIVRLYEGLPAACGGPNPSKRPVPPPRVFTPRPNATPEQIEEARKAFEARQAEKPPVNQARVSRVDVLGPYDPARGPSAESLKRIYACGHLDGGHVPGCERKVLTSLVRRAYRRPARPADVEDLVSLMASAQKRGESFDQALGLAVQAVLVSPDFLFRIEKGRAAADGQPGRLLTDHELASRLSYFLWASAPDDELLDVADRGRLHGPRTLEAQVRRMLADPKATALVAGFAGQWLQFRGLESVSPDKDRFPDFENNLRMAMRRETELFFDSLMREDKSVLDLLDGRYTYVNERLARHYGIAGVQGPEFRRVDLSGTGRGGVLTQASVLTVSSYATRTSPVLRGKWILENVLAAPPPDPPAGTPRLDEAKVGADASLRKQLEAHRTLPSCAACHEKMDPLGFSLESFDAIGAWRKDDGKWPIDASGVLPDGRRFEGPDGLKTVLRADRQVFAECVTEKMLTYALGRGLERYDKKTVRGIAADLAKSDYRFSALVLEIVRSLPFQRRRPETRS